MTTPDRRRGKEEDIENLEDSPRNGRLTEADVEIIIKKMLLMLEWTRLGSTGKGFRVTKEKAFQMIASRPPKHFHPVLHKYPAYHRRDHFSSSNRRTSSVTVDVDGPTVCFLSSNRPS
jgi:hypothetical protein